MPRPRCELAHELGQPADTPIYFAIDFDPDARQRQPAARRPHLAEHRSVFRSGQRGVGADALAGRRLWRRRHVPALKASGKAKYFWLSTSLGHSARRSSSTAGNGICFRTSSRSSGATRRNTFDTDVVNPSAPYFGQWTSRGPAPPHNPIAAVGYSGQPCLREERPASVAAGAAATTNRAPRRRPSRYQFDVPHPDGRGRRLHRGQHDRRRHRGRLRPHIRSRLGRIVCGICRCPVRRTDASRRRPQLRPSRALPAWEIAAQRVSAR